MQKRTYLRLMGALLLLVVACREDYHIGPLSPFNPVGRLDTLPYNPTPFAIISPLGLPTMPVPAANPTTVEGIKLGRLLFYDPILSGDSTMSCASCHHIEKAFTDGLPRSVGIAGIAGTRNAMTLINVGYNWKPNRQTNFNWDGAFATLEAQAIMPVQHPLELNADWVDVEAKLRAHAHYPRLFRAAFGVEHIDQIDREYATRAIAQFLRTLNSAAAPVDSFYRVAFYSLSPEAERGMELFIGDTGGNPFARDAECAHCHNFTRDFMTFARNDFSNNGLDSAATLNDFIDKGLGAITGLEQDNGRFREVTLRNIALTAPYMHDGRFTTLEQVLDHYVSGGHPSPNVGFELLTAQELPTLTAQEKSDIIAFLHALTDTSYFSRREWQNPFVVEENPW